MNKEAKEANNWLYSIDELVRKHNRPFYPKVKNVVRQSQRKPSPFKHETEFFWDRKILFNMENQVILIGGMMESLAEELNAVNMEVETSKKLISEAYNDIRSVLTALEPEVFRLVKEVRSMRMTVLMELQTSLAMLKDVRKFFLESDYVEEIKRLKEFIGTITELKRLKDEGTLDVIADTILILSEGGKKK